MGRSIKIGIFGARRGLHFKYISSLIPGVEVSCVCENYEPRLEKLKEEKIQVFTDFDEFIKQEFDILVVANYCTEHVPYVIKGLQMGKHVLSEVIACKTLAEGVRLCREVEKAEKKGVFYMLAENCCFFSYILEMERIYKSGKIGEIRYGEGEYIHDCSLQWHRLTNGPTHWRNWLPSTYYVTHSLGPLITITDLKPVEVSGFVVPNVLSREFGRKGDDWGILVLKMENDAVLRIIPWSVGPHDSLWYRIYGTEGMMENGRWENTDVLNIHYQKLFKKPELKSYRPQFPVKKAYRTGHGGADFFVLDSFIKSIRRKERPKIDVYKAMDMTLPGILGYRSALSGNIPVEIPDFRKESVRKKYENDNWSPDPKDKGLQKNQPYPSILGDVKIKESVYNRLEYLRKREFKQDTKK